ncbi:Transmembrane protein [Hirschfeldia incana]|nr:Transmembrane protein [Hirschfeldia incana]
MATERSSSVILLSVLILALVLSPILPCQAARAHLDVEARMLLLLRASGVPSPPPIRFCPACACCAPARPGACCPCRCTTDP